MTTVLEYKEKPSLFSAYVNVFTPGRAKYAGLDKLPQLEAAWAGAQESPEKIQAYREACGLGNDGMLPLLYPHILTSAMHIHMISDKRFPVSALGAVHARNHIVQRRQIRESERVDLRCALSDARVLKSGLEIDITTQVMSENVCIWESISSYLFLGKKFGEAVPAHSLADFEELKEPTLKAEWHVPADMGRRYAKITGDYNPIHVSKILAKAFGFKRDIIHGMWSLAKCLAHLQDLSYEMPLRLDVSFKGPVFMDSNCFLKAHEIESGYRLDLHCGSNPKPSIVCKVHSVDENATL